MTENINKERKQGLIFELYRFYEKEIQVMEAVLLLMTGIEYIEKDKEEGSDNNEI